MASAIPRSTAPDSEVELGITNLACKTIPTSTVQSPLFAAAQECHSTPNNDAMSVACWTLLIIVPKPQQTGSVLLALL